MTHDRDSLVMSHDQRQSAIDNANHKSSYICHFLNINSKIFVILKDNLRVSIKILSPNKLLHQKECWYMQKSIIS